MAQKIDVVLLMEKPVAVECMIKSKGLQVSTKVLSMIKPSSIPSPQWQIPYASINVSLIFIYSENDIEYPANFVAADGAFITTSDNQIFNVK